MWSRAIDIWYSGGGGVFDCAAFCFFFKCATMTNAQKELKVFGAFCLPGVLAEIYYTALLNLFFFCACAACCLFSK